MVGFCNPHKKLSAPFNNGVNIPYANLVGKYFLLEEFFIRPRLACGAPLCYHNAMLEKLKSKIDKELVRFLALADRQYGLTKISALLFKSIKKFVLNNGKRIRPLLFIIGYLGFSKKNDANLYRSAVSWELFHDFMLVHDDIIDKSDTRRGKPSMHAMLNNYLSKFGDIKFTGEDLTIVVGDVMYALAIEAFLSLKAEGRLKEKALKKFLEAVIYTGSGEFIELLLGIKDIEKIAKQDIYKIYDYKTAHYSFAAPLSSGAILAGAKQSQIEKLFECAIFLGRAFQIKDDIIGMFGSEKKIGKPILTDLQEAKKTLLVWYAFKKSDAKNKLIMKRILSKKTVSKTDLLKIREIAIKSGALDFAENEIFQLAKKALAIISSSEMKAKYKNILLGFSQKLLNL